MQKRGHRPFLWPSQFENIVTAAVHNRSSNVQTPVSKAASSQINRSGLSLIQRLMIPRSFSVGTFSACISLLSIMSRMLLMIKRIKQNVTRYSSPSFDLTARKFLASNSAYRVFPLVTPFSPKASIANQYLSVLFKLRIVTVVSPYTW
jgi:hypothetical protein